MFREHSLQRLQPHHVIHMSKGIQHAARKRPGEMVQQRSCGKKNKKSRILPFPWRVRGSATRMCRGMQPCKVGVRRVCVRA